MKPTKAQRQVIDLLEAGWELGWSLTMGGRVWLQKGGVGCGGETLTVRASTANALLKEGILVCEKRDFPTSKYRLARDFESKLS